MLFPQTGPQDAWLIRRPGSRHVEKIVVTPLTSEQKIAPIKQREEERKGGDGVLFTWKYLPDGSAYLKMPTWALYNSKWDCKQWLNEHLDDAATRMLRA